MRRAAIAIAIACAALSASCPRAPRTSAPSAEARALPLRRSAWSRASSTDARGFYAMPLALCEDFPEESTTPARVAADMALARDVGAKALRFGLGWDGVEEAPDRLDFHAVDAIIDDARAAGLEPIPYIGFTPAWAARDPDAPHRSPPRDPSAYARFVEACTARYRGRVRSWELWNEPDLPDWWTGTAAELAAMIREAARAARRADPGAVIVLGGMAKGRSPFLEDLLAPGGVAGFVDVVNVHAYLETWSNERKEALSSRLGDVADLVARRGEGADVWLAEIGYSSHRHAPAAASRWGVDVVFAHEHTPRHQAVELVELAALAVASRVPSLFAWYRIHDLPPDERVIGDENNHHLGLLDLQGRPKPALDAFRLAARLLARPLRVARDARVGDRVEIVLERDDGGATVVAWLRGLARAEVADASGLAADARREIAAIPLPGRYRHLVVWGADGARRRDETRSIEGALEGVELAGDDVFVGELER